MGQPKYLIRWFGRSFLEWIFLSWQRAVQSSPFIHHDEIVVILPPGMRQPLPVIPSPRVRYQVNPDRESDPFQSIKMGLERVWFASPADIIGIWPVDHPGVTPVAIKTLFSAIERSMTPVVDSGPAHWVW
ncbi:MAG: hypothetical protein D6820_17785, partial [Lentisphaerae bacterium]